MWFITSFENYARRSFMIKIKKIMKTIINNYLFFQSQNIGKSSYKSSVFWVLISCCLLFFPSRKVFVCCRFWWSKDRLCWLPFIECWLLLYKYINFRYQNIKNVVSYRFCLRVYTSRCIATLCNIFS